MAQAFLYEKCRNGLRVLACRGLDGYAEVPGEINGIPVTELGRYAFSENGETEEALDRLAESGGAAWYCADESIGIHELPLVRGDRLESLRLPESVRRAGAYCLYNCASLRSVDMYTSVDWGSGSFFGCLGIESFTMRVPDTAETENVQSSIGNQSAAVPTAKPKPAKSYMRSTLLEISQTVQVRYIKDGMELELYFPEYYEEAVENTPARILMTNVHGCGLNYRNAFKDGNFEPAEYDKLFYNLKNQESEALCVRAAFGRLLYPGALQDKYRADYIAYIKENIKLTAGIAAEEGRMDWFRWICTKLQPAAGDYEAMIKAASACGNTEAVSYLMNSRREAGFLKAGPSRAAASASAAAGPENAASSQVSSGQDVPTPAPPERKSGRRRFNL